MCHRRQLPGTLDALVQLPDIAAECGLLAGLDDDRQQKLRLAADEMITNVAVHGYEANGLSGVIDVDWRVTDDGSLVLGIEDDAPAFDPTSQADPDTLSLPLEDRPMGGLGILLTRRNVDVFRYCVAAGRNRVELVIVPSTSSSGGLS